jgi:ABC-type anion transport system duplicated permease subunit
VAIGFNPRLARIAQPIAQIAASVPATALFPVLLLALIRLDGGMQILSTQGLGAQISSATDAGRFDLLLLSTIVMAAIVVCINRLVWRRLYRVAELRYRLES